MEFLLTMYVSQIVIMLEKVMWSGPCESSCVWLILIETLVFTEEVLGICKVPWIQLVSPPSNSDCQCPSEKLNICPFDSILFCRFMKHFCLFSPCLPLPYFLKAQALRSLQILCKDSWEKQGCKASSGKAIYVDRQSGTST